MRRSVEPYQLGATPRQEIKKKDTEEYNTRDLMGIRAAWHKFTYMPEYVEHKHEYCTNEDAMNIFAAEQMARKAKSNEKSYWFDKSPSVVPNIRGFDGVAVILSALCIGSTLIAAIII